MNEIKTFDERKKALIKMGKSKGYITFEELADNLKGLELDSDSLDELYNLFHDMNIEVVSEEVEASVFLESRLVRLSSSLFWM